MFEGTAGQEVIAVISGEEAEDAVFNISIQSYNVISLANDSLGSDTGEVFTGNNETWTLDDVMECDMMHANSFSWMAPATGTVVFDTTGSMIDTVLGVATSGCSTDIECNDDADEGVTSLISMEVTQGAEYIIYVGSYDEEETGDIVVNITLTE